MKYHIATHTANNPPELSLPQQTPFFQSIPFFKLVCSSENFSPTLFLVYKEKELVASLLAVKIMEAKGIKGVLSSRVVIYGGPVFYDKQNHEYLSEIILKQINTSYRNKVVFIQFRNFTDLSSLKPTFEKMEYSLQERLNLLVNTTDPKETWNNMSSNRRRQVKKSLQNGAEIIEAQTIEQVNKFYDILDNLYKNKVHKPLPRYSLFKNFYTHIHGTGWGIILLVSYQEEIIGGILSPITPEKTIFEWYVCGLDEEYKDKKIYPSVLATWAAMDYALKNNIPQFDFMGVGIPERDYGVRDFKKRFGGEMVNYGRFGKINNRFIYTISELGYNILAHFGKI